jgi:hypothetical protein
MAYTTIDNPELYFQTKIYTGDGNDNRAITFDGSEDMQPDLTWFKSRSNTTWHNVFDSIRGANKAFATNATNAEESRSDTMDSFDSDGFTLGNDPSQDPDGANTNADGYTYVCWAWKESATAGFDMVSYTGNATGRTISHSLSAVPHFMLIVNYESATNRHVYHHKNTSAPATDYLKLNSTDATGDAASVFNDTDPTSSVFSVGTGDGTNKNTDTIIAYLFSEKQGFSKFGSYTGNGNADGPFVYTGFRPAYVMMKRTDSSGYHWEIWDNKRDSFNLVDLGLTANQNVAEFTETFGDFVSNGFKIRGTNTNKNGSGGTYIYMAFAEAPFVNSNGVPCNAR